MQRNRLVCFSGKVPLRLLQRSSVSLGNLPRPIRVDLVSGLLVDLKMPDLHVLAGVAIELAAAYDEDVAGGAVDLFAFLPQQLRAAQRHHSIALMAVEVPTETPHAHDPIAVEYIEHVDRRIDRARASEGRLDIEKRNRVESPPFLRQLI